MAKKSIFQSNNPMMNEKQYGTVLDSGMVMEGDVMTVQGAVNKTLVLMGVMLVGAYIGFTNPSMTLLWTGVIGGMVVYFITASKKTLAPYLAPVYAALEGLVVGVATMMYSYAFEGIAIKAAGITFAILFMMLMLYKSGIIKVTDKLRAGISMAVGAVMLYYLVNMVLYFLGIEFLSFLHEGGALSIGITLVIIGIASMNLLLDFDNFEKGEKHRAPAYMEWYFGMGLLFTLIWLYLEILRLLSYLASE